MTGSLQIKNGLYYAVLNFQDHTGKRKLKWFSTGLPEKNNKKRAEKVLQQLIEEWSDKKIEYESLTVAEYLRDWLEQQRGEVSPNTFRGYESNLRNHVIPYFAAQRTKLVELKAYQLEDYYRTMLRTGYGGVKGLSPTSIKHHHQNISKALHDAVRREILLYNPASGARTPKAQRYVGTYLNPKQLTALAGLFRGSLTEIPMLLIITYGLRRSEALALTWGCVDFEQQQITIAAALLQNTGGDYLRKATKSDSSYRTLPLTQQMLHALQEHKATQECNRKLMGDGYQQSDYVCTWPDGTLITPNYLTRTFGEVIRTSSLPVVRLHDLRHSAASNLLAHGFSVVDVQHWLGHAEPSTTLNFYAHVDSSSKRNISAALEKMLLLCDSGDQA